MMHLNFKQANQQIESFLLENSYIAQTGIHLRAVSGGDISACYVAQCHQKSFFIKLNKLKHAGLFEAEEQGLNAIESVNELNCPKPLAYFKTDNWQCLILEHLNIVNQGNESLLGRKLAHFHRSSYLNHIDNKTSQNKTYGFEKDNYIGLSTQKNMWSGNWCDFWLQCRLKPQLVQASKTGLFSSELLNTLSEAISSLLKAHEPEPCLLHGDLWSGNKAYLDNGEPVIYDPACYYGDRETDIAMTELFGGFTGQFYRAYNNVWPLDGGYEKRKAIYNLYHILNHFNLFGRGYSGHVQRLASQIIRHYESS